MATVVTERLRWDLNVPPADYMAQVVDRTENGETYFRNTSDLTVFDQIKLYMAERKDILHTYPTFLWGKSLVASSGPLLNVDRDFFQFKNKNPNFNFKKRCSEMEIITAPYSVGTYDIIVHPGEVIVSDVFRQNETLISNGSDGIIPYDPTNWIKIFNAYHCPEIAAWSPYVLPGYSVGQTPGTINPLMLFGRFGNVSLHEYRVRTVEIQRWREVIEQFDPSSVGITASAIRSDLINAVDKEIDSEIVMNCLAKANEGDFDALTALAELPETIRSIVDGFKFLAKACKEIKKKEFAIHSKREQYLMAKAREAYSRYKGRQDFATFYRKRQSYLNKLVAKQIASEVSSVYLNARYNIAPAIYTLQDIGETLLNWEVEFKRTRVRLFKDIDFNEVLSIPPGYTVSFNGDLHHVVHRAFIKRLYDASDIAGKLGRSLLTDFSVTAFEKVHYFISIIANWFISFETTLKAIRWKTAEKQQAACYSTKVEIAGTLTYTHKDNPLKTVKVDIRVNDYERKLINPSHHISLYLKNDLDIWKELDALAFAWNLVKGSVRPSHPEKIIRS